MLSVLFLGDIVGEPGRSAVIARLPELKSKHALDFVVVHGETAASRRGVQAAVTKMREETANILVDVHGETTSEKIAMGRFLDGKVSAVIGTHTHVQTADEQIFTGGTAFMCDAGMCGPVNSILGRAIDPIMNRFVSNLPASFPVAGADVRLHGALIEIDETTGRAMRIMRVDEPGPGEPAAAEPESKIHIEQAHSPEQT